MGSILTVNKNSEGGFRCFYPLSGWTKISISKNVSKKAEKDVFVVIPANRHGQGPRGTLLLEGES
jgi:hypothetical protein